MITSQDIPKYVSFLEFGQKLYGFQKYDELIDYFYRIMATYDYLIADEYISRTFWLLGSAYEQVKIWAAAEFAYMLALEFWAGMDPLMKRHLLLRLGYVYYFETQWEMAINSFRAAKLLYLQVGDDYLLEICDYLIACCFTKIRNYADASTYLLSATSKNMGLLEDALKDRDLSSLLEIPQYFNLFNKLWNEFCSLCSQVEYHHQNHNTNCYNNEQEIECVVDENA